MTLGENAVLSAQDIALRPVTNSSLAGSITLPEGYGRARVSVSLVPKPASSFDLFSVSDAKSTFSYVVPQIPQATFSIQVSASAENPEDPSNSAYTTFSKGGLTAGTSSAALVVPPASRPSLPANGVTDVTHTTLFSWSPLADSVYYLRFQKTGDPDWEVQRIAPFESMDDLVGFLQSGRSLWDMENASSSSSESRTFTTAAAP